MRLAQVFKSGSASLSIASQLGFGGKTWRRTPFHHGARWGMVKS
jgi:hypothetical protein